MPGVDVVEGDLHDFKVNARGFNSPTARTVLVLQDGRDVSVPFLGLQQWATLSAADQHGLNRVHSGTRVVAVRRERIHRGHQHDLARGS